MGFVDTIVMFAVVGTVFYGGFYALIKLGDLVRGLRERIRR